MLSTAISHYCFNKSIDDYAANYALDKGLIFSPGQQGRTGTGSETLSHFIASKPIWERHWRSVVGTLVGLSIISAGLLGHAPPEIIGVFAGVALGADVVAFRTNAIALAHDVSEQLYASEKHRGGVENQTL